MCDLTFKQPVTNRNALNTNPAENVNSDATIYNTAKMREALKSASERLRKATESEKYGEDVLYLVGCMRSVADECDYALAEPPRNCEMFNNADELVAYYGDEAMKEAWRELRENIKNDKYGFAIDLVFMIDWLFAKAKGEIK